MYHKINGFLIELSYFKFGLHLLPSKCRKIDKRNGWLKNSVFFIEFPWFNRLPLSISNWTSFTFSELKSFNCFQRIYSFLIPKWIDNNLPSSTAVQSSDTSLTLFFVLKIMKFKCECLSEKEVQFELIWRQMTSIQRLFGKNQK